MVSHIHLWSPGDPVCSEGLRLLMGVAASYAVSDLKLLDLLDEAIPSRQEEIWVDVFDLAKCRTQSDIQEFLPGITKLVQTPIWNLVKWAFDRGRTRFLCTRTNSKTRRGLVILDQCRAGFADAQDVCNELVP